MFVWEMDDLLVWNMSLKTESKFLYLKYYMLELLTQVLTVCLGCQDGRVGAHTLCVSGSRWRHWQIHSGWSGSWRGSWCILNIKGRLFYKWKPFFVNYVSIAATQNLPSVCQSVAAPRYLTPIAHFVSKWILKWLWFRYFLCFLIFSVRIIIIFCTHYYLACLN